MTLRGTFLPHIVNAYLAVKHAEIAEQAEKLAAISAAAAVHLREEPSIEGVKKMTPTVPVVLAIIGGVLLLLGILGGGIQGKFIVPPISNRMRLLSGGIGAALIAIAITRSDTTPSLSPVTAQIPPIAITPTAQLYGAPSGLIALSQWPTAPQDAARLFANGIGDWELTQGGWHLKDRWPPIKITVPLGVTMEGFSDGTNPPRTRHCMTVLGPGETEVQGATFWFPEDLVDTVATARKVHSHITAWTPESGGPTTCEAVGFLPLTLNRRTFLSYTGEYAQAKLAGSL